MRDDTARAEPRRRNLVLGGAGFLLLTAMVFWWQFSSVGSDLPAPRWDDLRWRYLPLLLLCMPLESVACALRIWVIARVLEPTVRLSTCFKAEWAQVAVSTLTPTQSGGGPGQIYLMHRDGVRIGTGVTIMLLSCLSTMLALLCLNLYALLAAAIDTSQSLRAALWTSTAVAAAMVLLAVPPCAWRATSAVVPPSLRRLAARRDAGSGWRLAVWIGAGVTRGRLARLACQLGDLLATYRTDTTRFLRGGKAAFTVVLALSLVFIVSRAVTAYLVVRFMGIDGSTFQQIFEAQIVILLIEFVAPTPGGAGIVEGASLALMADVVPAGHAPYYTLLWRFATLYLPALAGFVCLASAVLHDARRLVTPGRVKAGAAAVTSLAATPLE